MNPWHDVDIDLDGNKEFNSVVEIPTDSKNKYELDTKTGFLRLDRVIYTAMHYPANYGFIPQTLGEDGDPLDVLILTQEPIHPLTIVRTRAIAGFKLRDEKGIDDKIVCVSTNDPAFNIYNEVACLPDYLLQQIKRFFMEYKVLEGKEAVVGDLFKANEAKDIINKGIHRYNQYRLLNNTVSII